jgi:catechol 2,3-dioxygenase-like lactoylglutathione lyase family enzyme
VSAIVERIGLTVSSLDRATRFYTEVLGFRTSDAFEVGESDAALLGVDRALARGTRLSLGRETLELIAFEAPRGRPAPRDTRGNDRWFQHVAIIVSHIDEAYRRVCAAGVQGISPEPQRLPDWNPQAGGIRAYYFRDPDGHPLELLEFPSDKGDARWHATSPLFLGIDHTAIAVSDTERSLGLWRDALGLRVVGGSVNHGPEQERLSGVAGARVRITALRGDDGPGVELLHYLAPGPGRDLPDEARACDLVHWHTTVRVDDVDAALRAAAAADARPVRSRMPSLAHGGQSQWQAMLRDTDGHAILLTERRAALRREESRGAHPAGRTS